MIEVDHVVLCAGQESVRDLVVPGRTVIGGADIAAELDAKRAIKQGTEVAAALRGACPFPKGCRRVVGSHAEFASGSDRFADIPWETDSPRVTPPGPFARLKTTVVADPTTSTARLLGSAS